MKKVNYLRSVLAAAILFGVASCDDDDQVFIAEEQEQEQPMTEESVSVVLNEVRFQGDDTIELLNNGQSSLDLSNYWLCLGPGQYVELGTLSPISGNINLASGEYLVVNYELPDTDGGLGLYNTNEFTNAEALVDFVQWGSAGSAREDVAVAAGQWIAGEFVAPVSSSSNSIAYDGEGNAANDWKETTNLTFGAVNEITEPTTSNFNITITNIINYLAVQVFNTPDGASELGPVPNADGAYSAADA